MINFRVSEQHISLSKKLNYVLHTFNTVYAVNFETNVCYGSQSENGVNIIPADSNGFFTSEKEVPEKIGFFSWDGKIIPLLFQDEVDEHFLKKESNCINVHADILLSAFYFLSCWQEYKSSEQDKMGRFPYKSSLIKELEIAGVPVVNYYFDILKKAIQEFHGDESAVTIKQKPRLKVGLTHDIDQCKTGWKEDNFRLIKDGKLLTGASNIIGRSVREDIWFNFASIKENEKNKSISSSFYFIPEHCKSGGYPNADYQMDSMEIQDQIIALISDGFEVGIHGSIGSAFDTNKFNNEVQKFASNELGGRFHYLMMDIPKTWDVIAQSGLIYDSTLGFAEMIGFRNGFCYPFQPFDFGNDTHYSFWEYPMNVMDKTLMQPEYLHLDPDEAVKNVQGLIDEIQKWNGYFILNWHNNTLNGYKYRNWIKVYDEILDYCLEKNGKVASIKDHHKNLT